jgi:predicted O-methyltransferase YrrM
MMAIVDPAAWHYSEKYTSDEDDLLKEIAAYTFTYSTEPQMLSGHLQGMLLEMLSRMIQPKRILEIGTFTGYSALCLAKGLVNDGRLHTIEIRKENALIAGGYFDRSISAEKIKLHIGNAMEIIGELDETWDLVFIDADKTNYIHYFNSVISKVRQNGFILADNVLFHGQVLEAEIKGKNAKAIQAFNDFIQQRNDVERLMLPLRDGLYLIRKL